MRSAHECSLHRITWQHRMRASAAGRNIDVLDSSWHDAMASTLVQAIHNNPVAVVLCAHDAYPACACACSPLCTAATPVVF